MIKGYKMSFFVDEFLLEITSILNGFIWFLILLVFIYIAVSHSKWPVTAQIVHELTENQDLAIYHVKEARKFQKSLMSTKVLTPELQVKLGQILESLSMEFNKFRG